MPSDSAPVRSILAAEREQGRPFSDAGTVALETIEDRQAPDVLGSTRQAWRDGHERRPAGATNAGP